MRLSAFKVTLHERELMKTIKMALALISATFLGCGPLPVGAVEPLKMAMCSGYVRVTCVVDGDTLWFEGEKIRIKDIDTPEISKADCPQELKLAADATSMLIELLNKDRWTIERDGKDRYGRTLATILVDGTSVAEPMVAAGLAIQWRGKSGEWCS